MNLPDSQKKGKSIQFLKQNSLFVINNNYMKLILAENAGSAMYGTRFFLLI
jgi:hypothetical protein